MALIVLNESKLHIHVNVGVLEEYKPSIEIEDLYNSVRDLKAVANYKLDEICGEHLEMGKANELLAKEEDKKKQWDYYILNEYIPKVKKIIEEVDKINKEICPGYEGIK
jgi:hypothetical protein